MKYGVFTSIRPEYQLAVESVEIRLFFFFAVNIFGNVYPISQMRKAGLKEDI